jgi:hypothetical protein
MTTRLQRLRTTTTALVALSVSFLVAALPARADLRAAPWIDFRPNLKVSAGIASHFNPGTGLWEKTLNVRVENTGLTGAPASTTAIVLEAGDPFSPISTAIALVPYGTPALAPGAFVSYSLSLGSGTPVYQKIDAYADYPKTIGEVTEHDNHWVFVSGYAP